MTKKRSNKTILAKARGFIDRYRVHALATLAIVATLLLIASRIFPGVEKFVNDASVIPYLTFLIVLDLAMASESYRDDSSTRFAENQDESMDQLIATVPKCRQRQIDLIEYAGSTTLPLIRCIQRERVPMHLLVKHPDTVDGLQRDRMITTLDTLYNSIFHKTDQYEIRCYRLPYSLRGRHLHGQLLELGWLTPDPKRETAYGHANPSSLIDLSSGRNVFLRDFFERTFNDLWEDDGTEDGLTTLNRLQRNPGRVITSPPAKPA